MPYKGRNELETLLASDDVADWMRIAEMFLGRGLHSSTLQISLRRF
jgi:hypothetical protein